METGITEKLQWKVSVLIYKSKYMNSCTKFKIKNINQNYFGRQSGRQGGQSGHEMIILNVT